MRFYLCSAGGSCLTLRRWLAGFRSDVGGSPRDAEPLKEGLSRRGLLGLFAGAAVAVAVDPELALWTPGKKLISIPSAITREDVLSAIRAITSQQQFIINSFKGQIYISNQLDVQDTPVYDTITYGQEKTRPFSRRATTGSTFVSNPKKKVTLQSPAPGFENILTATSQRRNGRLVPQYAGGKC